MRLRSFLLVLALLLATTTRAFALAPDWRASQYAHRHFGATEGLPHGLANSIAQTGNGYLWVGTEEGVARFDGQRFRIFDRRSGLAANTIAALAVDAGGAVWIGMRDRGLARFSGESITTVTADELGLQVRALAFDRAGELWVGTHDRGVAHLRGERVLGTLGVASGLPSEDVRAVLAARDGSLWLGTLSGAVQVVDGRVSNRPAELADVVIHAIAQDRTGAVWFGTSKGLARLREGRLAFVESGLPTSLEVMRLLFDRDGNLWMGTRQGLARRSEDGRVERIPSPASMVLALFEDHEGTVWAGDETGLERLTDPDFRPIGAPEGLTDSGAYGILEDRTGAMWIGTTAGVFRIPVPGAPGASIALDRGTVYAVHEDAHGDVWAGARDGSVGRWQDGRFAWLGRGPWEKVRVITEADGALWLGTDHGLFRHRGPDIEQAEPVVPGPIISAIARDAGGALWLGTEGRGLLRLEGGRLGPVPAGGPSASSSVTTFTIDPDGTLWVGTEGDGLWRLRADRWASFTTKDGLFDDLVWRILDDGQGHLWMSSNRGIWRVARSDLEARASGSAALLEPVIYGEADGMRDRECNGAIAPAGWRARDGRLWFPTGDGAVVVDPARTRAPSMPSAMLEGARIDGDEVQHIPGALVLPAGSSRFELQYTTAELRTPERVRFRYRLEGFDTGWHTSGTGRLAQYTNLSPGTYRFVVQASTGGAWGKDGRLEVRLLPRFYQTTWFRIAAAATALLVVLAIHLLRVRQLRAREAELARRVEQALGEVKVLSGMLPICAWCKNIRDDHGYWNKLEAYLHERTNAHFSHGMCPDCFAKECGDEDDADTATG